jgi:predicted PurR-regulated permease PerM
MRLSPLDDTYERELLKEFDGICRAVVTATLLAAVVQGLLAGFGFWLAGLDSVFLLMLLTTVFAMVPFVGAATVWVPASLWLYFYDDQFWPAVLLAIYGAAIVSTSDNIIKPLVLSGTSNLHPLLALLSVLGGVQVMGPIGIFVGPMIVVFFKTMLDILQRELTSIERTRVNAAASADAKAPAS